MPYKQANQTNYILANWNVPKNINAVCTTRRANENFVEGYGNFNLALHVGDNPKQVEKNRQTLGNELNLLEEPCWLTQTHSNTVIEIKDHTPSGINADASYTSLTNKVCAILTADCLPILLCNHAGTEVAALHCGWRGLYHDLIQNTLTQLNSQPQELMAWLGPAIGVQHYQVGDDLREQFIARHKYTAAAFSQQNNRWHLDLYLLARILLNNAGVQTVSGGEYCTYSHSQLFYSHRKEGPNTGRISSLIWFT